MRHVLVAVTDNATENCVTKVFKNIQCLSISGHTKNKCKSWALKLLHTPCNYIDTSCPLGPVTNQEHTKRT